MTYVQLGFCLAKLNSRAGGSEAIIIGKSNFQRFGSRGFVFQNLWRMWKSSDAPEEDGAKFGSMQSIIFMELCYISNAIFEAMV